MRENWAFKKQLGMLARRRTKRLHKHTWEPNEHWDVSIMYQGRLPMFITTPAWRQGRQVVHRVIRFGGKHA